jgi:hypothetical protein
MTPKKGPHTIVVQKWEESERGWGTRPDGYTMHLTEEDRVAFCKKFWADERKRNPSGVAPSCYSRECGSPYAAKVDRKTYNAIEKSKSKHGVWGEGNSPPEFMCGVDGWLPKRVARG